MTVTWICKECPAPRSLTLNIPSKVARAPTRCPYDEDNGPEWVKEK